MSCTIIHLTNYLGQKFIYKISSEEINNNEILKNSNLFYFFSHPVYEENNINISEHIKELNDYFKDVLFGNTKLTDSQEAVKNELLDSLKNYSEKRINVLTQAVVNSTKLKEFNDKVLQFIAARESGLITEEVLLKYKEDIFNIYSNIFGITVIQESEKKYFKENIVPFTLEVLNIFSINEDGKNKYIYRVGAQYLVRNNGRGEILQLFRKKFNPFLKQLGTIIIDIGTNGNNFNIKVDFNQDIDMLNLISTTSLKISYVPSKDRVKTNSFSLAYDYIDPEFEADNSNIKLGTVRRSKTDIVNDPNNSDEFYFTRIAFGSSNSSDIIKKGLNQKIKDFFALDGTLNEFLNYLNKYGLNITKDELENLTAYELYLKLSEFEKTSPLYNSLFLNEDASLTFKTNEGNVIFKNNGYDSVILRPSTLIIKVLLEISYNSKTKNFKVEVTSPFELFINAINNSVINFQDGLYELTKDTDGIYSLEVSRISRPLTEESRKGDKITRNNISDIINSDNVSNIEPQLSPQEKISPPFIKNGLIVRKHVIYYDGKFIEIIMPEYIQIRSNLNKNSKYFDTLKDYTRKTLLELNKNNPDISRVQDLINLTVNDLFTDTKSFQSGKSMTLFLIFSKSAAVISSDGNRIGELFYANPWGASNRVSKSSDTVDTLFAAIKYSDEVFLDFIKSLEKETNKTKYIEKLLAFYNINKNSINNFNDLIEKLKQEKEKDATFSKLYEIFDNIYNQVITSGTKDSQVTIKNLPENAEAYSILNHILGSLSSIDIDPNYERGTGLFNKPGGNIQIIIKENDEKRKNKVAEEYRELTKDIITYVEIADMSQEDFDKYFQDLYEALKKEISSEEDLKKFLIELNRNKDFESYLKKAETSEFFEKLFNLIGEDISENGEDIINHLERKNEIKDQQDLKKNIITAFIKGFKNNYNEYLKNKNTSDFTFVDLNTLDLNITNDSIIEGETREDMEEVVLDFIFSTSLNNEKKFDIKVFKLRFIKYLNNLKSTQLDRAKHNKTRDQKIKDLYEKRIKNIEKLIEYLETEEVLKRYFNEFQDQVNKYFDIKNKRYVFKAGNIGSQEAQQMSEDAELFASQRNSQVLNSMMAGIPLTDRDGALKTNMRYGSSLYQDPRKIVITLLSLVQGIENNSSVKFYNKLLEAVKTTMHPKVYERLHWFKENGYIAKIISVLDVTRFNYKFVQINGKKTSLISENKAVTNKIIYDRFFEVLSYKIFNDETKNIQIIEKIIENLENLIKSTSDHIIPVEDVIIQFTPDNTLDIFSSQDLIINSGYKLSKNFLKDELIPALNTIKYGVEHIDHNTGEIFRKLARTSFNLSSDVLNSTIKVKQKQFAVFGRHTSFSQKLKENLLGLTNNKFIALNLRNISPLAIIDYMEDNYLEDWMKTNPVDREILKILLLFSKEPTVFLKRFSDGKTQMIASFNDGDTSNTTNEYSVFLSNISVFLKKLTPSLEYSIERELRRIHKVFLESKANEYRNNGRMELIYKGEDGTYVFPSTIYPVNFLNLIYEPEYIEIFKILGTKENISDNEFEIFSNKLKNVLLGYEKEGKISFFIDKAEKFSEFKEYFESRNDPTKVVKYNLFFEQIYLKLEQWANDNIISLDNLDKPVSINNLFLKNISANIKKNILSFIVEDNSRYEEEKERFFSFDTEGRDDFGSMFDETSEDIEIVNNNEEFDESEGKSKNYELVEDVSEITENLTEEEQQLEKTPSDNKLKALFKIAALLTMSEFIINMESDQLLVETSVLPKIKSSNRVLLDSKTKEELGFSDIFPGSEINAIDLSVLKSANDELSKRFSADKASGDNHAFLNEQVALIGIQDNNVESEIFFSATEAYIDSLDISEEEKKSQKNKIRDAKKTDGAELQSVYHLINWLIAKGDLMGNENIMKAILFFDKDTNTYYDKIVTLRNEIKSLKEGVPTQITFTHRPTNTKVTKTYVLRDGRLYVQETLPNGAIVEFEELFQDIIFKITDEQLAEYKEAINKGFKIEEILDPINTVKDVKVGDSNEKDSPIVYFRNYVKSATFTIYPNKTNVHGRMVDLGILHNVHIFPYKSAVKTPSNIVFKPVTSNVNEIFENNNGLFVIKTKNIFNQVNTDVDGVHELGIIGTQPTIAGLTSVDTAVPSVNENSTIASDIEKIVNGISGKYLLQLKTLLKDKGIEVYEIDSNNNSRVLTENEIDNLTFDSFTETVSINKELVSKYNIKITDSSLFLESIIDSLDKNDPLRIALSKTTIVHNKNEINTTIVPLSVLKSLEPKISKKLEKIIKVKINGGSRIQAPHLNIEDAIENTEGVYVEKENLKELPSNQKGIYMIDGKNRTELKPVRLADSEGNIYYTKTIKKGDTETTIVIKESLDGKIEEVENTVIEKFFSRFYEINKKLRNLSNEEASQDNILNLNLTLEKELAEIMKDYKVLPMEIVVPFTFKHNGKELSIDDFLNEKGEFDASLIDPEILMGVSYRIPYQNISSGLPYQIVGFSDRRFYGETTHVCQEIVITMGSDFDVDKLYFMSHSYKTNENGKKISINSTKKTLTEEEIANKREELELEGYDEEEIDRIINSLQSNPDNVLNDQIVDGFYSIYTNPFIFIDIITPQENNDVDKVSESLQKIQSQKEQKMNLSNSLSSEKNTEYAKFKEAALQAVKYGINTSSYQRLITDANAGGKEMLGIAVVASLYNSISILIDNFATQGIYFRKGNSIYSNNKRKIIGGLTQIREKLTNEEFLKKFYFNYSNEKGEIETKTLLSLLLDDPGLYLLNQDFTVDENGNKVDSISNILRQLINISVDNAKEQKIGELGLNKFNVTFVTQMVIQGIPFSTAVHLVNHDAVAKVIFKRFLAKQSKFSREKYITFANYSGNIITELEDMLSILSKHLDNVTLEHINDFYKEKQEKKSKKEKKEKEIKMFEQKDKYLDLSLMELLDSNGNLLEENVLAEEFISKVLSLLIYNKYSDNKERLERFKKIIEIYKDPRYSSLNKDEMNRLMYALLYNLREINNNSAISSNLMTASNTYRKGTPKFLSLLLSKKNSYKDLISGIGRNSIPVSAISKFKNLHVNYASFTLSLLTDMLSNSDNIFNLSLEHNGIFRNMFFEIFMDNENNSILFDAALIKFVLANDKLLHNILRIQDEDARKNITVSKFLSATNKGGSLDIVAAIADINNDIIRVFKNHPEFITFLEKYMSILNSISYSSTNSLVINRSDTSTVSTELQDLYYLNIKKSMEDFGLPKEVQEMANEFITKLNIIKKVIVARAYIDSGELGYRNIIQFFNGWIEQKFLKDASGNKSRHLSNVGIAVHNAILKYASLENPSDKSLLFIKQFIQNNKHLSIVESLFNKNFFFLEFPEISNDNSDYFNGELFPKTINMPENITPPSSRYVKLIDKNNKKRFAYYEYIEDGNGGYFSLIQDGNGYNFNGESTVEKIDIESVIDVNTILNLETINNPSTDVVTLEEISKLLEHLSKLTDEMFKTYGNSIFVGAGFNKIINNISKLSEFLSVIKSIENKEGLNKSGLKLKLFDYGFEKIDITDERTIDIFIDSIISEIKLNFVEKISPLNLSTKPKANAAFSEINFLTLKFNAQAITKEEFFTEVKKILKSVFENRELSDEEVVKFFVVNNEYFSDQILMNTFSNNQDYAHYYATNAPNNSDIKLFMPNILNIKLEENRLKREYINLNNKLLSVLYLSEYINNAVNISHSVNLTDFAREAIQETSFLKLLVNFEGKLDSRFILNKFKDFNKIKQDSFKIFLIKNNMSFGEDSVMRYKLEVTLNNGEVISLFISKSKDNIQIANILDDNINLVLLNADEVERDFSISEEKIESYTESKDIESILKNIEERVKTNNNLKITKTELELVKKYLIEEERIKKLCK